MRYYFAFLAILFGNLIYAQPFSAGPHQTICIGETTSLQGTGPTNYTYIWTSVPDDPTISDPTSLTPTITPSETTVYTLEGRSVAFSNLVINGNFENGNVGFTSSYIYSPGPNGLWNEGTYAITSDAFYNHNNFTCNNDHTTGSGNFMAINGAGTPNVVVWSTTVNNITINTEYEFSTWVASLSTISPAILQFRINGVLVGEPFQASSATCQWIQFFEQWNSGTSTSAEISIVNQNTASNGNDFSLDDINFSKVTYFYDDCTVTVNSIPTSGFDIPAQSCSADTVIINYSGTPSATATYNWDFGDAIVHSGSESGPYIVQWANSGLHSVSLYVDDFCLSDTTTKNINVQQSPSSSVSADATSIPYGTSTILHGTMNGNPGPLVFDWDPIDKLQSPDILDPETILLENSTLFTFTTNDESSMCSSNDTLTIKITGGPLTILSLIASPDTICLGTNTTLSISIEGGSGDYESTWRSQPSGFSYTGNENQVIVSPNESTMYYVSTNDGFNITPEDSIYIVVLPQIEITDQPHDTLIAVGQNAIFSVAANNEITYQWQVSEDIGATWIDIVDNSTYSGSQTPQLAIINASAEISFYIYRCVLAGKCDPVFSVGAELVVIDSPMFIGILDDVEACQNDTIYVPCQINNFIEIDSFNLSFTFDTNLLLFTNFVNNKSELSSITLSQDGESIVLDWYSSQGITISNDIFFEFGFVVVSGGEDSLKWEPTSVVRNSYGFYPNLQVSSANITVMALPIEPDSVIAYPDSLNILDEINIDLEAFGGFGYDVVWTQDSCSGDSIGAGSQITIFRPEQTTTYYVHWKNLCGISTCKDVRVKVIEQYSFTVPNAFTPNGDGLNDEFGIVSPSTLPVFDFYIFNRWGQLVFSAKNQNETWDGKYNGELSPIGVYIWKAKYQYKIEGKGSEIHEESGTVTLIK